MYKLVRSSLLFPFTVHPIKNIVENDAESAELFEGRDAVARRSRITCPISIGERMPVFQLFVGIHEGDWYLAFYNPQASPATLI
jgi:hypothetical protein